MGGAVSKLFQGDHVNGYEIEEPTEEQLACIMRDIPGEAG